MFRECIPIQWVSTAVQYKSSYLYPIELTTQNDSRITSDKRPRYFGPAADPEQPSTSGTQSSDTPIIIDDEDEGLSGKPNDLIPVSEVLKISKTTLMLIGNASSYISETRTLTQSNSLEQN